MSAKRVQAAFLATLLAFVPATVGAFAADSQIVAPHAKRVHIWSLRRHNFYPPNPVAPQHFRLNPIIPQRFPPNPVAPQYYPPNPVTPQFN